MTPDQARLAALRREYGALVLAVGRVRALHHEITTMDGYRSCAACCDDFDRFGRPITWPCPTIAALDDEPDA